MSQLNYLIPLWTVLVGVPSLGERPELKHLAVAEQSVGPQARTPGQMVDQ